jgi:hypothetical protein
VKSFKTLGMTFLNTRSINQDPLENFFCQIRQHGGRNINPTPSQFQIFFKTLLLNNFTSSHSMNANCEHEESSNIISSVKKFFTQGIAEEIIYENIAFEQFEIPPCTYTYIDKIGLGYVSGFIAKNIKFNNCRNCKESVICNNIVQEWSDLTLAKEYVDSVPRKLKYCTPNFISLLCKCYNIMMFCLPKVCHLPNCIFQLMAHLNRILIFDTICDRNIKKKHYS